MTVYIEKPAVNLREELASLRNQGGYEEQQFYFDGLVTNGTFDSATTGWTVGQNTGTALATVSSGQVTVSNNSSATYGRITQPISTVVGKQYSVGYSLISETNSAKLFVSSNTSDSGQFAATSILTDPTTGSISFTAIGSTTYIGLQTQSATTTATSVWDNISVFETDGTNVVHRMPKGWVPKDVFEDGLLQREGAANDYTVVYDGFDYYVKPAVAPSATTTTCVIGVRK